MTRSWPSSATPRTMMWTCGCCGVPVIDGDPIELGAEVLLHLADQLAGEALEVGHLRRVLGRDDEAEMMAILLAPLGEGLGIGILGLRTEQPRLLPVPGDALAPEIAEVGRERRCARRMADDAGLDRHQTRAAGQQTVRLHAGDPAAAEASSAVRCAEHALARDAAAGALGGGERLGDEGLGALAARRADAAWARLEIVLVSHRRPRQCAEKSAPAKRCGSGAPCAPGPHIAGSLKNPNKNNRPTEPHLAAFYLALGRLVSAFLPCPPFLLPGRTLCRARLRNRALELRCSLRGRQTPPSRQGKRELTEVM